jgi:integrase/recombinase XerD
MKPQLIWHGEIGSLMEKHLSLRKAIGRVGEADRSCLHEFNHFLNINYPKLKVPNRISILHFLQSKPHLSIASKKNHVIFIRQFCMFLNQRGIPCYAPDKTLIPKYTYHPRYFSLSEEHVQEFMKRARGFRYNHPLIGETYATVLGLLWCTGMRVGEVSRLTHKDVDFDRGLLVIRQTKFFKDRIIPVSKTTMDILRSHVELKEKFNLSCKQTSPFFMSTKGTKIPVHSFGTMFKRLVDRMEMKDDKGRHPVLHDFRHNFATRWIHRFYQDTEKYPPQVWMARLSTFMGHSSILHTQYYIHPDFELSMKASDKISWRGK